MSLSAIKQDVNLYVFVFSFVFCFFSLYCSDGGGINQFCVDIEMTYIRAGLWAQVSLYSFMETVSLWIFLIQEAVIFVL